MDIPFGPWFIAIIIIVALFMAVICTTILYVCCKGCSGDVQPIYSSSVEDDVQSCQSLDSRTLQDKPPSYRRFLRRFSNMKVISSAGNVTNRVADTGTPPPKYDDVVNGKFQFSAKDIKEYASLQAESSVVCSTTQQEMLSQTNNSREGDLRIPISEAPPAYSKESLGGFFKNVPSGGSGQINSGFQLGHPS